MNIGEPNENFWAHWSNIEWMVAGIMAAMTSVGGWVWRLSLKVTMLEEREEMRDRVDKQRHEENIHLQRGIQMRIDALTARIDRWVGRGDRRGD